MKSSSRDIDCGDPNQLSLPDLLNVLMAFCPRLKCCQMKCEKIDLTLQKNSAMDMNNSSLEILTVQFTSVRNPQLKHVIAFDNCPSLKQIKVNDQEIPRNSSATYFSVTFWEGESDSVRMG